MRLPTVSLVCLSALLHAPLFAEQAGPNSAEDQLKTFTVPAGFEVELVTADPDVNKIVDIAFDDAGRMWAVTATEYPVDGNENPAAAAELYKKGGRDKILIFETPHAPGRQKPHVFAEGLAMPMAVLPYKDGAIVGQGPEIFFLRDTNHDGKGDTKEVLLSGFGVQDSHLMPHRFVRGPGDWIYFAQGAFNASNIQTKEGAVAQFNHCKMGRFKLDGANFQTVCAGLNNIWGFSIDRQGEMFIQEANDLGYPVVPFFIGASYPGIGNQRIKPYAPWQPHLAEFRMGGTGMSGLAQCDEKNGYAAPYSNAMFVANPITRMIQAIQITRKGTSYALEKLPDFMTTTDEWFRPVAIHFGPCGNLYIVDWYNKIISHNEVPRNHPDRDKTRSRIWRVRHKDAPRAAVPDLTRMPDEDLLNALASDITWQGRAAWRQIVDRNCVSLAAPLKALLEDKQAPLGRRLLALWSLEGLKKADAETLCGVTTDPQRAVRREAVRALAGQHLTADAALPILTPLIEDPDPQVRAEVIRALDEVKEQTAGSIELLVRMAKPVLDTPQIRLQQNSEMAHTGDGADRDFERYLIRTALEKVPPALTAFLDSPAGKALPLENRVTACLALDGKTAAQRLQQFLPELQRAANNEELYLLAEHAQDEAIGAALAKMLNDPKIQADALSRLMQIRDRIKNGAYVAHVGPALKSLYERDASDANADLLLRVATSLRVKDLETNVLAILNRAPQSKERQIAALKALREIGTEQLEGVHKLASAAIAGDDLQKEAVLTLASSKSEHAIGLLIELWPRVSPALRKSAVDRLTGSAAGGAALMKAIKNKDIRADEIDGYALEKLKAVLPNDTDVAALHEKMVAKMRKVLRLNGEGGDFADTDIALDGPFTVETWVKLDPGIDNFDSILGMRNGPSLNFFAGHFRVYLLAEGDAIIAKKQMLPEMWTHWAVTRSTDGRFKIYMNGELDTDQGRPSTKAYRDLKIGRSTTGGTAGQLAEFRVWNRERSANEIAESFALAFDKNALPQGLIHHFGMDGNWGPLKGKASVQASLDLPPLLTAEEAKEQKEKFDKYRKLAEAAGDAKAGKAVFTKTCMVCHKVRGEGNDIGPNLDGAAAMGLDGLLRSILTPSAAVESGYRKFQVETKDKELLQGILFSQDDESLTLRPQEGEKIRVARARIKRAAYTNMSMMPDGLLDTLPPQDVSNLFTWLRETTSAPQKIDGGPELPVPPKGEPKDIALFNGKDLTGFSGDGAYWSADGGAIVARAPQGVKHNTFLCSTQRLGDFRLVLKVKLKDDQGNSGIQIRSQALPNYEAKGYQADVGPGWWGKIYEENGRGLLGKEGAPEGVVKKGDWNDYEVLCVGDRVRVAINGKLCTDLNDPPGAKEGVICFQLHSGGPTEVMFKDIKVTANPKDELETVK